MLGTNVNDKFFSQLLDDTSRENFMAQYVREVECVKRLCKSAMKTAPTYPRADFHSPSSIPLIGIDIGGTLAKLVYFEPDCGPGSKLSGRTSSGSLKRYFKLSPSSEDLGRRDAHLEMANCRLGGQTGTLHFVHFPSCKIDLFLEFAESKGIASISTTICATGGGAQLINDELNDAKENFGTKVHKYDELDCLLRGIHFIESCNPSKECYYFDIDADRTAYTKVPFDLSDPYPYLVVNIGSGVSILAVHSPTEYRRITGTSLGGGTFLGLCCLLTGCETFEEAIELAEKGESGKVDKLVKDIYGGDYPKFNLRAGTVASSFGNMNCKWRRELATKEDLARATLVTVTNNISSIARMSAINEGISRIVFAGNFLRVNVLSMHMLAYAMHFWSHGALKALFLEHEGYFGAVGCMVEHIQGLEQKQLAQASPP